MISARSAVDQDRMVETGTLGRIAPPSTRLRAWSNSSLGHKEPSCLGRCCGLTAEDSAGGPEAAPTAEMPLRPAMQLKIAYAQRAVVWRAKSQIW